MCDEKVQRSAGIRVEKGSSIFTDNVTIDGFDDGISVDSSSKAHVKNTSITGIKNNMTDEDLENIKELLRDEFKGLESIVEELKGKKDSKSIGKTLEKLSPILAEAFFGLLRAKGYIE